MTKKMRVNKTGSPKTLTKKEILRRAGELETDRNILIRLNKRLAIKLYRANPEDEIFSDGTFVDSTVELIKKEAGIIDEMIKRMEEGKKIGEDRAEELNAELDKNPDSEKTKEIIDRMEELKQHTWPEGSQVCKCGSPLVQTHIGDNSFCPIAHPDLAKIEERKKRSRSEKGEKVKGPNLKKNLDSNDVDIKS